MALSVKGTALKFGIGTAGLTAPTVTGISNVTSAEVTSENSLNTSARSSDGETVTHVFGDPKATMRVEGFGTAASLPALDSVIAVGGAEGTVQRSTVQASNEDFVKLSAEGEQLGAIDYTP